MNTASLKSMQTDHPDEGTLQLYVLSSILWRMLLFKFLIPETLTL